MMDPAVNYAVAMLDAASITEEQDTYTWYLTGDILTTGTGYVNYVTTFQVPTGTYFMESYFSASNSGTGGARIEMVVSPTTGDNSNFMYANTLTTGNGATGTAIQGSFNGANTLQSGFFTQLNTGSSLKKSQTFMIGMTTLTTGITMTARTRVMGTGTGAGTGSFHANSYIKFNRL